MKSCLSCKRLRKETPCFDSTTAPGTLRVFCTGKDGKNRHKDFPYGDGDKDTGVIRCDEFEEKAEPSTEGG